MMAPTSVPSLKPEFFSGLYNGNGITLYPALASHLEAGSTLQAGNSS